MTAVSALRKRFPPCMRLHNRREFSRVMHGNTSRIHAGELVLFMLHNHLQHARIGIVTPSKKNANSVQRHRTKRLLRESFRIHAQDFPGMDFVILARKNINIRSNRQIARDLESLWQDSQKKIQTGKVHSDACSLADSD